MHYLLTNQEMSSIDRHTIDNLGIPGIELMESAGDAVAQVCMDLVEMPADVVVACGKGNNGGDGFVVARLLAAEGAAVHIFLFAEEESVKGEAEIALERLYSDIPGVKVHAVLEASHLTHFERTVEKTDVVIDALLGTGLKGAPRPVMSQAIDMIAGFEGVVIAVDIPSGVCGDTGMVDGAAVKADCTVTFAFPKRGHFLFPGAAHAGDLCVADIGIPQNLAPEQGVQTALLGEEDISELISERLANTHKGTYGHVAVWAGQKTSPGAAILALMGALRSGAGLVSWVADEATLNMATDRPPEAMLRVMTETQTQESWLSDMFEGATAVVTGPGLSSGESSEQYLKHLLYETSLPLCLDAEALNILAAHPHWWQGIRSDLVLTPHPKEMARLTGKTVAEVQADRMGIASSFAKAHDCVLVLKGASTVVAASNGDIWVVGAGNAGMATGGSGDVLAGMVGAFLAAGYMAVDAAKVATLLHACAGDLASETVGETALIASDIVDALGPVLHRVGR